MTPKEKAEELYTKYNNLLNSEPYSIPGTNYEIFTNPETIKKATLIAANEIIIYLTQFKERPYLDMSIIDYWYEVKQEIEKL